MKRKGKSISSTVQVGSSVLTLAGVVWIGGFQYSEIKHEIHDIKEDIQRIDTRLDRMETRFDRMETEFHKMYVRVNILEHKP